MKKKKMNKNNEQPVHATPDEGRRAFERVLPELTKLAGSEVLKVNTDVKNAALSVLRAEHIVRSYEDEIKQALPKHDLGALESLRDLALAAFYADAALAEKKANDPTAVLVEEAQALKYVLLASADALAVRGDLDSERIAEIRKGQGHLDLAADMLALSALFKEAWSRVEVKTVVKISELARAEELGVALFNALGERDLTMLKDEALEARDLRARAFSLMMEKYGEVQNIVRFVRYKAGDADEIAPSVYAGLRGGSRRNAGEEEAVTPIASTPVVPAVSTAPEVPLHG